MIKDWYRNNYKTDELGEEINLTVTFNDLYNALLNNKDIYDLIGVSDSLIRERLFEKLSDLLGVKYEDVYSMWLDDKL